MDGCASMPYQDVILDAILNKPPQGGGLVRPDFKAYSFSNGYPVPLLQGGIYQGSQQLPEARPLVCLCPNLKANSLGTL